MIDRRRFPLEWPVVNHVSGKVKAERPNTAALWLVGVLLAALSFAGWKAWEQAAAYEQTTLAIIDRLDADARVETLTRRALEWLSFGLYEGEGDEIAQLNDLKSLQLAYRSSVQIVTIAFFGLMPALLVAAWGVRRDAGDVAYAMLAAAVIALAVGLSAPILSVEASKSLPLLGETVFQFESKGVLATIGSLARAGNLWLAVLLFCFSVLIPVLKTLLVGLTFFARTHHWSLHGLRYSRHVGKWSMADVFVVAILVAFFAANGNGVTRAEVQAGLYFFTAYVVLSLVATQVIGHRLERTGSAPFAQPE
jgi:paraquat-inducible protein A